MPKYDFNNVAYFRTSFYKSTFGGLLLETWLQRRRWNLVFLLQVVGCIYDNVERGLVEESRKVIWPWRDWLFLLICRHFYYSLAY